MRNNTKGILSPIHQLWDRLPPGSRIALVFTCSAVVLLCVLLPTPTVRELWVGLTTPQAILLGAIIAGVGTVAAALFGGRTLSEVQRVKRPDVRSLDRAEVYEKAASVLEEAAKRSGNGDVRVINLRSAQRDVPPQNTLYDKMISVLKNHPELQLDRIITYESDPHLWITRRFLKNLADRHGFCLVYTFGNPTLPSSVISDTQALLGLLGRNGEIEHGMLITNPRELTNRFFDMYENIYRSNDEFTRVVKGRHEVLSDADINQKLKDLANMGEKFGKPITHWEEPPADESTWISTEK